MKVHPAFKRFPGREVTLCVFQTENGSALHEAALFGKMDVVRLLLGSGGFWGSQVGSEGLRWVLRVSDGFRGSQVGSEGLRWVLRVSGGFRGSQVQSTWF